MALLNFMDDVCLNRELVSTYSSCDNPWNGVIKKPYQDVVMSFALVRPQEVI